MLRSGLDLGVTEGEGWPIMMWGYGQGMVWMWLWVPLLLVGIALLVLLAVRVFGNGHGGYVPTGPQGPGEPPAVKGSRARQILDERFAKGELTADQYREYLKVLGEGP
ncbi:UNVERIFIED_CONTAM: putative membrane protein [Jeotgalibacillus campisalis]